MAIRFPNSKPKSKKPAFDPLTVRQRQELTSQTTSAERKADLERALKSALDPLVLTPGCVHVAWGYCGRCSAIEEAAGLIKEMREFYDAEPDEAKKEEIGHKIASMTQGCHHGVEQGYCEQCAIEENIVDLPEPIPPTPLGKLMKKEAKQQLAGQPRMDTTRAHEENPRPLAGQYCSAEYGQYAHSFELPRNYNGSMSRAHVWWPDQPPPVEECKHCQQWRDGRLVLVSLQRRPLPEAHPRRHATGGWAGRTKSAIGWGR
jgi:hypothetical protein